MGRLTAGLLHELSHPMQCLSDSTAYLGDAVTALLDAVRRQPEAARSRTLSDALVEVPVALEQMREGVALALEIMRAARTFSHPGGQEVNADLNQIVNCAVILARSRIRPIASFEVTLEPVPPVWCDPGRLTQAIVNLLLNSADAVEEHRATRTGPGAIRVRTRVDGEAAMVSVYDDGPGIPAEIRDRILEPFFTTKPAGLGTGQGLPIARGIVESCHGGSLTFDTEVGRGTAFHIRLPLRQPAAA